MAFDDLFNDSKEYNNEDNKIPDRDNPTNYYFVEYDNSDMMFGTRDPVFIVTEKRFWDNHGYFDWDNGYMPVFLRKAHFGHLAESIYDYKGNGAPFTILLNLGCEENPDILDGIHY